MTTDYQALKNAGFIRQRQKNFFSLRLGVTGGSLDSGQLAAIAEAAEKYGAGRVHLTSRQGVEIPFVRLEDAGAISAELEAKGVPRGICGSGPRAVTACQGREICSRGRIETRLLAEEMARRYTGRKTPHKFKIGITGCRNDCLKAEANDLGIKGGLRVSWQGEACSFCGLCAKVCRSGAVALDGQKMIFKRRRCRHCGRCADLCPAGAWRGEAVYILYFGGTFGNRLAPGWRFPTPLTAPAEVLQAAGAALNFFSERGKPGERFRATLEREGRAAFEKALRAAPAAPAGEKALDYR